MRIQISFTFVCILTHSREDGDRDLLLRQAITNSTGPNQKESYDPFPLSEREDGEKINPLKDTSWGHKENVVLEDIYIKDKSHLLETEGGDVKQEKMSDKGESSSSWSPTDSGLHSTSTDNTNAFNSTPSVLSSDKCSKSSGSGYTSGDLCLPDSTTDSVEAFGVVASPQSKNSQPGLDSLASWTSPKDGTSIDTNSATPPSVFSESVSIGGENTPAPLPDNGMHQSASFSHYQGGGGGGGCGLSSHHQERPVFSANGSQASGDSSYISQNHGATDMHTMGPRVSSSLSNGQELLAQNGQTTSCNVNTDFAGFPQQQPSQQSGTSNKQLYQLLSQQPLPNPNPAPGYHRQPVEISPSYPCTYQNMATFKSEYSVEASNGLSAKLPPWNGISRKENVIDFSHHHHVPNSAQAGFDFPQRQHEIPIAANGNHCAQGVWPVEASTLPQLTDEDMKMLDCFNEASPTRECLPYPQALSMASGNGHAPVNGH